MIIQSAPPGPASLFSMSAFGRPDQRVIQQIQERNVQNQQMLMQNYGFDASHFFQQSAQFFQQYQALTGMQQAETMITMGMVASDHAVDSNFFSPIIDTTGFQKANLFQQVYLMANPLIQEAALAGTIHGYGATHHNHYGTGIGWENPVYRQAVSGLSLHSYGVLPDDVDDAYTECLDDPLPGLPSLSPIEQSNLAQAWKLQDILHAEGIDTTHPDLKPIGD